MWQMCPTLLYCPSTKSLAVCGFSRPRGSAPSPGSILSLSPSSPTPTPFSFPSLSFSSALPSTAQSRLYVALSHLVRFHLSTGILPHQKTTKMKGVRGFVHFFLMFIFSFSSIVFTSAIHLSTRIYGTHVLTRCSSVLPPHFALTTCLPQKCYLLAFCCGTLSLLSQYVPHSLCPT